MLLGCIKKTKKVLKEWDKHSFGNVQDKILQLKKGIDFLQNQPQTDDKLNMERVLTQNLEELLKWEELLWKDKAKVKLIEVGDINTHFFHISTDIHRRKSNINCNFFNKKRVNLQHERDRR